MDYNTEITPSVVLHWNYRGLTEFPLHRIYGEESEITDIYLKENLISRVPNEICKLQNLESLYLSGNDICDLPKEISQLQCLKCLDLSGNRLKCLPEQIGELRSLKFLILDENELTELPLRLSELRFLRYLSVCDNNLQWLPQRPVYNYQHCEFRFWRNPRIRSLPYSLWYHMFRNQQTRSISIGCLNISALRCTQGTEKCRLTINQGSSMWDVDVSFPPQHTVIENDDKYYVPSLFEICKRQLYLMLSTAAKRHTDDDKYCVWPNFFNNNASIISDIEKSFSTDNDNLSLDENGNKEELQETDNFISRFRKELKAYYVPSDVIDKYFNYLPYVIKEDLCNGPVSRCENLSCKSPIFNHVYYEFCLGKMILIGNGEDIILSAAFCSKSCADVWKSEKIVIPWKLVQIE